MQVYSQYLLNSSINIGLLVEFICGFGINILTWMMATTASIFAFFMIEATPFEIIFNKFFFLELFGGIGIFGICQLTIKLLFPLNR